MSFSLINHVLFKMVRIVRSIQNMKCQRKLCWRLERARSCQFFLNPHLTICTKRQVFKVFIKKREKEIKATFFFTIWQLTTKNISNMRFTSTLQESLCTIYGPNYNNCSIVVANYAKTQLPYYPVQAWVITLYVTHSIRMNINISEYYSERVNF